MNVWIILKEQAEVLIFDLCVPRSLSLLSLTLTHFQSFFRLNWIFREKGRQNARFLLHDTVRFVASLWWTVCVHNERERSFSCRRRRFRFASHHRGVSQSQCLWQTKELLPRSRSRDRYVLFLYLSLLLRRVVVLVWRCLASSRWQLACSRFWIWDEFCARIRDLTSLLRWMWGKTWIFVGFVSDFMKCWIWMLSMLGCHDDISMNNLCFS